MPVSAEEVFPLGNSSLTYLTSQYVTWQDKIVSLESCIRVDLRTVIRQSVLRGLTSLWKQWKKAI